MKTKMLKQDAESSVCTYDKAMPSLPLHTSTQRCDRCTCTHAHTQLAQRYDRCWCIHLHSDTIADDAFCQSAPLESLKGVLAPLQCLRRSIKHSHGLLGEVGAVLASGHISLNAIDHVIQLDLADAHCRFPSTMSQR